MFAKNLEFALANLCQKCDVAPTLPDEFDRRFDALRRYGKLPRGRERRNQPLTNGEIAAAVLGLATSNPGWAGHAAVILCNLQPVGGVSGSFFGTFTLRDSIERILIDPAARRHLVRLTVSVAESAINSNGYATLLYETAGARVRAFYVPKEAVSLLQPGAERNFDPDILHSLVSNEICFNRKFFERLTKEIEIAASFPAPPAGDGSEYDAEEVKRQRYEALGVRKGSRFLNIGVDHHVTWPSKPTLIRFDRYQFVLMPKTRDNSHSISIDLAANSLTNREAVTVINRFLSVMTWLDDHFAIAQNGWSGNPVPVPVPNRNLGFTITDHWVYDCDPPSSKEAQKALALYREARNAQENFLVSYAVLNYYKIIEIKHGGKNPTKQWFRDRFEIIKQNPLHRESLDRFSILCGGERPHEYIYNACRIAVAHAGKDSKSDPDDASELTRLHEVAEVLRIFARHFISTELGVPDGTWPGEN